MAFPGARARAISLDSWAGIILGTHHEKGAFTFWSYAIGLPLPSSSILSWKFCHVLHKVLRDGHPNVSVAVARWARGARVMPSALCRSRGRLLLLPAWQGPVGEGEC